MQQDPSVNDSAHGAGAAAQSTRTRPLDESPALAAQAVNLLRTPQALFQLDDADSLIVVAYMRLVPYAKGSTVFRAGDQGSASFMLLIIEGEVSVETGTPNSSESVEIAVLGPGSVIGEMALLDGSPRSANCVAVSNVKAAGLSRRGLEILMDDHPRVAARLLVGLAQRIADRLRAMDQQIQIYAQLNSTLQQQLEDMKTASRGGRF